MVPLEYMPYAVTCGNTEIDFRAIPYGANTLPEIVSVGLTGEEANAKGYEVNVAKFRSANNCLATILSQRIDMMKVITEGKYNQIVGTRIIDSRATELIAEAVLAMKLEITPSEISTNFHHHLTIPAGFWEVKKMICGG